LSKVSNGFNKKRKAVYQRKKVDGKYINRHYLKCLQEDMNNEKQKVVRLVFAPNERKRYEKDAKCRFVCSNILTIYIIYISIHIIFRFTVDSMLEVGRYFA
jgi:hypothetical protein